jgi:ABC-2 type transport system permease protein
VSALAILLSALNVYARDLQHLLELVMLAWFWLTPILYPWGLASTELENRGISSSVLLLNPMSSAVLTFQRAIYGIVSYATPDNPANPIVPDASPLWYLRNLSIVLFASLCLLAVAIRIFGRIESSFAEAL